ncbi:MAG: HAD-IA family hydrolase [Desulfobacterales bacterium]
MTYIAQRLLLPESVRAILWDMDGVLLDSLGLDQQICDEILHPYFGTHIRLGKAFIRSLFAYHPEDFWRLILDHVKKEYGIAETEKYFDEILRKYCEIRNNSVFETNPGIREILTDARKKGLKLAVVSNNPTADVKQVLDLSGILAYFDLVVGNDVHDNLKKKPAPDTYLFAAESLHVRPEHCAVIEDSVIGAQAGRASGAFVIGVATGGADFADLENSGFADRVYAAFAPNSLDLKFGKVTNKKIVTPNEFASHMAEHIAWRMGTEIDLHWNSNDFSQLGKFMGERIRSFPAGKKIGTALGMIDDGSTEIVIALSENSHSVLQMEAVPNLDLQWFLNCRCEQMASGKPLLGILEGLAEGLLARIHVRVCSAEDPHHTWEGIFRGIGIALFQIFAPEIPENDYADCAAEEKVSEGEISVLSRSCNFAQVSRGTAESFVKVKVDFSAQMANEFRFAVSPSINVAGLPELFSLLAQQAGFSLQIDYNATVLSSSHVVLEDTGLVLGRALKEILILRMEKYGISGCGSSIAEPEDFETQNIRVGLSAEGRKFWKFVPFRNSLDEIRRSFIIGQTVCDGVYSEDLDDFLDGLAGGLGCSILIHMKQLPDPEAGWKELFAHLGKALREVYAANPFRKGVPPGVKATLV